MAAADVTVDGDNFTFTLAPMVSDLAGFDFVMAAEGDEFYMAIDGAGTSLISLTITAGEGEKVEIPDLTALAENAVEITGETPDEEITAGLNMDKLLEKLTEAGVEIGSDTADAE